MKSSLKISGGDNMPKTTLLFWIIISVYILLTPQSVFASDNQIEKKLQKIVEKMEAESKIDDNLKPEKKSTDSKVYPKKKEVIFPSRITVYKPLFRGSPVGRVAGGTRGILDKYPSLLCVITPDHTAFTIRDQPQFYWFLGRLTTYPIELTIIEDQAIYPVLEVRISSPELPGIQRIRLADYGIHLQQGLVYKWFIALLPDTNCRSKDILAWGAVKYIKISDELNAKLSHLDKAITPNLYAAAGIWYDAFAEISDLIETSTNNVKLKQRRDALLEQIGLPEIAQNKIKTQIPGTN